MPPNWRPGLDEDKRRAILDSGRLIPVSPRGGLYLVSVAHFPVEQTATRKTQPHSSGLHHDCASCRRRVNRTRQEDHAHSPRQR
jgi:hypothetical protein